MRRTIKAAHADALDKSRIPFFLASPGETNAPFIKRYGIAVLSVLVAFLVRFSLRSTLEDYAAFSLFTPAIIVAAWYGGTGPALLASIASFLLANFFFLKPFFVWTPLRGLHVVSALIYLFAMAVVLRVVSLLRVQQKRISNEARDTRHRAKELEVEIARRGKAEQQLREQEERLRLIFQNARGIAIISYDIHGRIDDWNEGAERVFGYSKEEILGRDCEELFTPEDRALNAPAEELREARVKRSASDDRWHLAKDGRRIYVNGITCAKYNAAGELIGYLKIARDQTERHEIEVALQRSEWQLRRIFDSAEIGIVEVDPQGRFINANPKFCRTMGYTMEELRRRNFFELTHPDDRPSNAEAFRKLAAGETEIYESEKRCICKSGKVIWSRVVASFLRDELGNPTHSIAIVEDVTERKESEGKIRENEERLRLATESAGIGLWHWDLESGRQEWSPIARQHLGHFADTQASLENFMACLHPDDHDRVQKQCRDSLQDGVLDAEYRVVWHDQSIHWIWARGRFLSQARGTNRVFIGITMDITERKLAAEQLQNAVSLFKTILESTDDGILVVDISGKTVAHNQKFARMWKIPNHLLLRKDDIVMLSWASEQLVHPEQFLNKVNELMHSDEESRDHLRFKDGRIFERFSQPHRIDGRCVGRVWSFRDVTELTRANEKLLAHSEELETRVAERTAALKKNIRDMETFLYAIAHDLRAPLRAMSSFADLLMVEYGSQLEEAGREYCRRINESSLRMNRLISDILSYGRLTHTELPKRSVDLNAEVDKVLASSTKEIEERHGSVQVQKPLPKVAADAVVLDQVIENLITNAIKFVPPGRDPRLRIYAEEHENNVRLCLEDNGIGIAPEDQSRIFGPFQRLHSTDEYPGTGIGLAIVQRGVEKMGGHVGLDSTPGRGSRFWVELQKENGRGGSPAAD